MYMTGVLCTVCGAQVYLIYNMDHMRILGTEPSSLILSQTKYKCSWKSCKVMPQKCQNKLKSKVMVYNYVICVYIHLRFRVLFSNTQYNLSVSLRKFLCQRL